MDAPAIRYARTGDGVNIAYWTLGEGPTVIVLNPPHADHLEFEWDVPALRRFYGALAQQFRVVRYNRRGHGLSDDGDDSLDGFAADIQAVVTALNADSVAMVVGLTSITDAAAFAARYPSRVVCTVALQPMLSPGNVGASAAVGTTRREMPRFFPTFMVNMLDPEGQDAPEPLAKLTDESFRRGDASSSTAAQRAEVSSAGRDEIPQMQGPLLAIHWPDVEWSEGPELARLWPDARLVTRPGAGHYFYDPDPESLIHQIREFVLEHVAPGDREGRQATPAGTFQTILFTDVVASTPLLTQLRDERMRELMRDHDAVCEAAITEHGGRVVKTIGDAFMAEFSVPSAAIEAAIAIQRGIREQFGDSDVPVRLRIGINAGEPIVEDDDLHGASVVIAKRLESEAETDGILVSDVVRQAVAGKDFEFEDRGEVELKGFDLPIRTWTVRWDL